MMAVYLDDVLDNLENKHCILLLGPQVARTRSKEVLSEAVFARGKQELDLSRDNDGLYTFGNGRDKTRFPTLMKKFILAEAAPSVLHRQIARIRAPLVISLTPDHLLQAAFEEAGIEADFDFYHKGLPRATTLTTPTADRPLVYNLFGSIYEPASLINTQDDLFDFLFAVLSSGKPLPEVVESAISSARLFLFLGFEFDKWYLRLILRLFGLHRDPIALAASPALAAPEAARPFYERQFEMVFVSEDMEGYLGEVYTACEQRGNMLREVRRDAGNPLARQIMDRIKADRVEEALELLENYFEQHDVALYNSVMVLSGRYNGLTRKLHKGTIGSGPADIEMNQIRDAVLSLTEEL